MHPNEPWLGIESWLAVHARATFDGLRPGATNADVDALESLLQQTLPSQLRAFLLVHNGADVAGPQNRHFGWVLPGGESLGVHEIGENWSLMTGIGETLRQEYPDEYDESAGAAAATPGLYFLPSFIPIVDQLDGNYLFVDNRRGESTGCVGIWSKDDVPYFPPEWSSVDLFLESTRLALVTGKVACIYRPVVEEQALDWEFAMPEGT
ncbi:SMI1 / KNR4 family (SUKH-1) [Nakamurella panacisegetis]|uniref:SMI1 / KNR4 family (SUKH-1) n=1 Tax=Nakamurella panacisegetis TaxID=1090615 RepID=A0A1H0RWG9_9ACTN|nr:SMI1/KNR4 family protein [Nakamurella panacisegetis]SDP33922.1 SMI1 / KNR4 family (SUKH-1) [Nakamurella panacisegetis]